MAVVVVIAAVLGRPALSSPDAVQISDKAFIIVRAIIGTRKKGR